LGLGASVDDPLSLLGLSAEKVSEAGIIASLQRQLTRIAASPDALTPEADEVRLALHAAAARLLDPNTRRQIMSQGGAPATTLDQSNPAELPIEAAMLMTMGAHGGWNKQSMHKVALLARTYGLAPTQTLDKIRGLMNHPAPPPRPLAPGALKPASPIRAIAAAPIPASISASLAHSGAAALDTSAPLPEEIDPGQRIVKNILLFGGAGLVGIIAIAVLTAALLSGHNSKPVPVNPPPPQIATTTPDPDHQLFPTHANDTNPKPTPVPAPQQRIGDWHDQLRAMSNCVAGLDVDAPAAAERFESAYNDMAKKWGQATPDGVVAGVDRIVEYLYHASTHGDLATRAVTVITDGLAPLKSSADLTAQQVSTAPWSAGVLARLARERDLPASVRHRVQEALADSFPGSTGPGDSTFKSGALAALSSIPARLSKPTGKPDPKQVDEAWKAWLAALSAIDGKQSPLFTRTVLIALDSLLTNAPEPTQDRTIFDAMTALTIALPWRKDDESRRWLLRWFDSPGVSSGDLYALTAALATQSGAEGVDSSMVLSAGAGESQRAELRDRYAAVWSLTAGQTRDSLVAQWAKVARAALPPPEPSPDRLAVDSLDRAVTLARLNQAASLLWSGDTSQVPDLLEPYKRPTPFPIPGQAGPGFTAYQTKALLLYNGAGAYTDWLVKYQAAERNGSVRRALLAQLGHPPTPAEADILVQEACRGMPANVRADARAIVMNFRTNATIINAMLEFAPMVPITNENNELVEAISSVSLPSIKDPTWRVAVRRALVERLTEVLAGQGELAKVDDFSDALLAAYTPPAPKPVDNSDASGPLVAAHKPPALPLETAAMSLRGRWQREAELLVSSGREPLSLGQVEGRRSARVRLAVGRIQEFAAEQVNICELMSFVVTAEQPGKAEDAAAALDELAAARRKSKHIFDQLEAAERARLKLWLTRFGEPQA
jgi:hypothetical protein